MTLYFRGLGIISGPRNFYLRTKQRYKADKRGGIPEAVSDSNEELYLVDASAHLLDFRRLSSVQSSHFGTECPTLCAKTANTIWAAISEGVRLLFRWGCGIMTAILAGKRRGVCRASDECSFTSAGGTCRKSATVATSAGWSPRDRRFRRRVTENRRARESAPTAGRYATSVL